MLLRSFFRVTYLFCDISASFFVLFVQVLLVLVLYLHSYQQQKRGETRALFLFWPVVCCCIVSYLPCSPLAAYAPSRSFFLLFFLYMQEMILLREHVYIAHSVGLFVGWRLCWRGLVWLCNVLLFVPSNIFLLCMSSLCKRRKGLLRMASSKANKDRTIYMPHPTTFATCRNFF